MRKLYKRPTIISNVKRILALPCHLDGVLFFELGAEALVKFGWTVVVPDPKEIYHKITGEPIVHTVRQGGQDIAEAVGVEDDPIIRGMGRLLGVIDSAVWAVFLFSALQDSLLDATSQYIRMDPCPGAARPGDGTNWISAIDDKGTWGTPDFQFTEGSPFYPVNPAQVRLGPHNGYSGVVACNAQWGTLLGPPLGVTGQVVFIPDSGGEIVLDQHNNADSEGNATQKHNTVFAAYKDRQRRSGVMKYRARYDGIPLPSHEAFLKESTCYLAG